MAIIFSNVLTGEIKNVNFDHDDEGIANTKHEELQRRFECAVCFSGESSYLISPCNHLCCCEKCANRIQHPCPICRHPIGFIERVFFV
jgi:hypothetical protein